MTTTTLTFLVILLSITTLTFFILSIFAVKRSNKIHRYLDSVLKDYEKLNSDRKGLVNIIDIKTKEVSDLTKHNQSIQKDNETLTFKLHDELRFQEEQIQKQRELFAEENNNERVAYQKEKETLIKENGELLNLIENLEKVSNERLEEIQRLTNTET